jgi:hypothetical protein
LRRRDVELRGREGIGAEVLRVSDWRGLPKELEVQDFMVAFVVVLDVMFVDARGVTGENQK